VSVDVVIVSWNHATEVGACLRSIASGDAGLIARIIVVENGSASPYAAGDAGELPPVTVVRNADNRGFAPACNQGAALGRGRVVLFLNPDTLLPAGAVAAALATLDDPDNRDVAMIGLGLQNPDGTIQPSCGRFLTAANVFWQISGLSLLAPARCRGLRMSEWGHDTARDVEYASGACLFVRRACLEALGGFDERFVLYLEDADLALRARWAGWRTRFLPAPRVVHRMGWSTGRNRTLRLAHSWRSVILFARVHLPPASRAAVALTVLAIGPIARAGQAIGRASARDLRSAAAAAITLWRLLLRDRRARRLPARRHPASSTPAPALRDGRAGARGSARSVERWMARPVPASAARAADAGRRRDRASSR
jgi:GT2 family glycosyltransferase